MVNSKLIKNNIVIIGDVIIDKYIDGKINKISPEAPIPILEFTNSFSRFGGASNVAINVSRLIGKCSLIMNQNNEGFNFKELEKENIKLIWNGNSEKYSVKTRIICNQHQFIRIDKDEIVPKDFCDFKSILNNLVTGDILMISDYGKGAAKSSQEIIKFCKERKVSTMVDPKFPSWINYEGAEIMKCNRKEFIEHRKYDNLSIDLNKKTLQESLEKYKFNILIVTLGSKGLCIVDKKGNYKLFESRNINVYDVSGAGDAVFAGVAFLLNNNLSILKNGFFLTKLGEISVQEIGTSSIKKDFKYIDFIRN